jgi:hypothetical protein
MAYIKLADACLWLNDWYDAELTYQQLYMLGLQRRIPVERDETGRNWVIAEDNLPGIGKTLGLAKRLAAKKLATRKTAVKPAGKPSAKPKPVAKPGPNRPARSRASRSAAA